MQDTESLEERLDTVGTPGPAVNLRIDEQTDLWTITNHNHEHLNKLYVNNSGAGALLNPQAYMIDYFKKPGIPGEASSRMQKFLQAAEQIDQRSQQHALAISASWHEQPATYRTQLLDDALERLCGLAVLEASSVYARTEVQTSDLSLEQIREKAQLDDFYQNLEFYASAAQQPLMDLFVTEKLGMLDDEAYARYEQITTLASEAQQRITSL